MPEKEENTSINVSNSTWKKLTQIKLNEELDTIDEVIKLLLKNYE